MSRPTTTGFQKPLDPGKHKPVGLAIITYYGDTHAGCSCGWAFGHLRAKVREDAIDRHLTKAHGGVGIRI